MLKIVQTTTDSAERAREIARMLVEQRLAACVHIVPIQSVYRWQGAIEEAQEWTLQAKTTPAGAEALCEAMVALHSYDEPEVIVLDICPGTPGYAQWVEDETRDAAGMEPEEA